ncbi:MAG: RsmD family RNA methyltransferase [Puniceicoccales bacterium]|jgi:16S rRNA (guanine966-N2)-methyltransferase|nr:RsmD family RNA methyltransferase [Puniceicoccales bacterium]
MRITGGLARGIALRSVRVAGLRPATSSLRQAIFSFLSDYIMGQCFLDLFAGTGSYGLEALSRGADSGIFVESDREIAAILEENLAAVCKSMGSNKESFIWNIDIFRLHTERRFDLIFIDPPYETVRKCWGVILMTGVRLLRQREGSRIILEMPGDLVLDEGVIQKDFGLRVLRHFKKRGRNSPTAMIFAPVV